MFRNQYDSDISVWSPQGRIHQIEYAMEAVKQGSAVIGLVSKTHAVLVALKRSTGDLASYQQKVVRVDDHMGIGFAGLSSDARVLCNYLRSQALQEKLNFGRNAPLARLLNRLSDKAQSNTQRYGRRPYGVGLLVIGVDNHGPQLFEFSPSGNSFRYYAMAIGARSQSAKTYLEKHYESFADCGADELVIHGLTALRDTLQQDKELTIQNVSVSIVSHEDKFKIYEDEDVREKGWLDTLNAGGEVPAGAVPMDVE